MSDTLTVPQSTMTEAADSALATHEILDDAAHAELAVTEDEDVTWLTNRLDSVSGELANLRSSMSESTSQMMAAFQESREQSRTLIEAQSQMIATLTDNLTALSGSVLLRLTQPNSESTLPNELPATEVTEITEPVAVAQTQEPSEEERRAKKRARL